MFIKRVSLRGFCTYKDETNLELSPKYNCIVGLNGSGKSNMLLAISFIMAELGGPSNDRKMFLHEGASTAVTTAHVEVVFDNSDRRLNMFNENEVVIKRIFSSKKDDWLLNGKHIMKNELVQLLESAGFSRSNPYFIVRQGKISELTTMTDAIRLKLLKDIAGTKIYDAKRAESLKYLYETEERRYRIDETIRTVQKKMEALKQEQKDLQEYYQLDKSKRFIEYCLNEIEWRDAFEMEKKSEASLKSSEDKLVHLDREAFAVSTVLEHKQNAIKQFEKTIRKLQRLKTEKQESLVAVHRCLKRVELELQRMKENEIKMRAETAETSEELPTLRVQIEEMEKEMETRIRPELSKHTEEYESAVSLHSHAEQEIAQLYAKQNRGQKFGSVEERNKNLKKQLKELESKVSSTQKDLKNVEARLSEADKDRLVISESIVKSEELSLECDRVMEAENKTHKDLSEELERLTEDRRILQYKLSEHVKHHDKLSVELNEVEERYWRTMRNGVRRGIKAAEAFCSQRSSLGIFGLVIDNIEVAEVYRTAVEVVANSQLFNLVVSNAAVASEIVTYLTETNSGALTISPLEEIRGKIHYRSDWPTQDDRAIPLINCLKYDEALAPVIHQIWGQTLLVKDSDTALEYKDLKWDCITPDGDLFSRKGLVSGGFTRPNISRLYLHDAVQILNKELKGTKSHLDSFEAQIQQMEEGIRSVRERLILCGNRKLGLSAEKEQYISQLYDYNSNLRHLSEKRDNLYKTKISYANDCEDWKNQIQTLRREILTPKLGLLTSEEQKKLKDYNESVKGLKTNMEEAHSTFFDSKNKFVQFEGNLEKLRHRFQQLELGVSSSRAVEESEMLLSTINEQTEYEGKLSELRNECESLEKELLEVNNQLKEENASYEQDVIKSNQLKKQIASLISEAEQRKHDVEIYKRQKEEASGKRFTLPSVNPEFEKYQKMSRLALTKEHSKIIGRLSNYAHINRKPVDQLSLFIEEQEMLMKRKEEINDSFNSIVKLIEDFDEAKEKTLMSTFQKINTQFGTVFGELIPNGKAKLVLKRLSAEQLQTATQKQLNNLQLTSQQHGVASIHENEMKSIKMNSKIESIVGIGIKVSFSGAEQTFYTMHQLSGGQKTVVALSLIFAIQRCDPAPFYLFDEIDAALDDQYRAAVAQAIQKQSNMGAQFLITTFRPELVEPAEHCFKVTIRNRASAINPISKEEALYILEEHLAIEDAH